MSVVGLIDKLRHDFIEQGLDPPEVLIVTTQQGAIIASRLHAECGPFVRDPTRPAMIGLGQWWLECEVNGVKIRWPRPPDAWEG